MRLRPALAIAGAFAAVLSAVLVPSALAEPEHAEPQGPARAAFGRGFPRLVDHEWGFRLGGFGGTAPGASLRHVPVIFVHGNNVDAADWYPVRDQFRKAGWTDQELWALSYNGLGSNNGSALATPNPERDEEHRAMGSDGVARVTNNEVNVPDLHDFITAVRSYTGSPRFVIVGHSLGVTLARRTLKVHRELRKDLVAFVGIAGGNHGTSFCPPGSEGQVVSCDEIAKGTEWLAALNGRGGADETYGPARWLTVYDGSGAGDPAFAGPDYAQSPALKGAVNRQYPGTYHNDLRLDPAIVDDYRAFIAESERDARPADAASAPAPAPAPTPAGVAASGPAGASGPGVAMAADGGSGTPSSAGAATDPAPPASGERSAARGEAAVETAAAGPAGLVERAGGSGGYLLAGLLVAMAGTALLVLDPTRPEGRRRMAWVLRRG